MKRPEGFDPQKPESAPPAQKRPAQKRPAQKRQARTKAATPKSVPSAGQSTSGRAAKSQSAAEPSRSPKQAPKQAPKRALNRAPKVASTVPARVEHPQAAGQALSNSVPKASRQARRAASDRRRFERDEIRRFTRRARHRRLTWIVAIATVLALVGTVAIAVYSPILALTKIEITGTASLNPDDLLDAVDGQLGTPLALVDSDRLTRDLSEFTLIQSYVTEIVPPNTLIIHVTERKPVGTVITASGFTVVDPAGVVIEKMDVRPPGIPTIELSGAGTDSEVFDAVVEVLLALPAELLVQVDRVTAETKDDVTLVFVGVGQRVVWGSAERSDLKARVLAKMMARHDPNTRIEYDVTAPLNVVVRAVAGP